MTKYELRLGHKAVLKHQGDANILSLMGSKRINNDYHNLLAITINYRVSLMICNKNIVFCPIFSEKGNTYLQPYAVLQKKDQPNSSTKEDKLRICLNNFPIQVFSQKENCSSEHGNYTTGKFQVLLSCKHLTK